MTNYDRYLDPPDPPTHGPCDKCGAIYDNDDLNLVEKRRDIWVCDECLEEYYAGCSDCGATFERSDLSQIDRSDRWLCGQCFSNYCDALEAYEYD